MSYEDQPHTSSSGTVVAIVAVVVALMLGGLVVLGLAGLFFFRLSAAPQVMAPPPVLEQQFVAEPAQPIQSYADQQVQAAVEILPPDADVRKFAVRLDAQGKILADGQAVDIGELENLLVKARGDGPKHLEVVIEVDRQCLFEHVAAVQAVCKQAGVENVRVQALTTSQD